MTLTTTSVHLIEKKIVLAEPSQNIFLMTLKGVLYAESLIIRALFLRHYSLLFSDVGGKYHRILEYEQVHKEFNYLLYLLMFLGICSHKSMISYTVTTFFQ